jgi:hypothetical protein
VIMAKKNCLFSHCLQSRLLLKETVLCFYSIRNNRLRFRFFYVSFQAI